MSNEVAVKESGSKRSLIGLICFILLVGAGIAAWFFLFEEDSDTSGASTSGAYSLEMLPIGATGSGRRRRLLTSEGRVYCLNGTNPDQCNAAMGCSEEHVYISQAFLNDPNDDGPIERRNIPIFLRGEPVAYTVPAGKSIENYTVVGLDAYHKSNRTLAEMACAVFGADSCRAQVQQTWDEEGMAYLRASDIPLTSDLAQITDLGDGVFEVEFEFPLPDPYGYDYGGTKDPSLDIGCRINYGFIIEPYRNATNVTNASSLLDLI